MSIYPCPKKLFYVLTLFFLSSTLFGSESSKMQNHFLLKKCSGYDHTNFYNQQLFEAIRRNDHKNIVWLLCFCEASINAYNENGVTALHEAIAQGNPKTILLFLNFRILFDLARKWFMGIRKIQLQGIANIEAKTTCGWTPLHIAAYLGNPHIVTLLLDYCANPYARTPEGKKPSDIAKNPLVKEILIQAEMHNIGLFKPKSKL